jgi:hypothetical protein
MEALEIYKTKKKINLKLTVKIEIYVLMQKNYVIFVKELEVKEMKTWSQSPVQSNILS